MSAGKNAAFLADPVGFMRKYAVLPPNYVGNYLGDEAVTMNTTADVGADYKYSDIQPGQKIAYLNFAKKARNTALNLAWIHGSEGSVSVDGTYTYRAHKVKAYWLPWMAAGGIIRLEIPDKATIAPGALDSDYFFTSTISGCSIFIQGTRRNPIIHHAGGPTNKANPVDAADFWRGLIQTYSGPDGAILGEVNKTHYVADPLAGGTTTPNAVAFEAWLNGNTGADFEIQSVEPFGCVMGIRDAAGDWTFYLQENATILFCQWRKRHVFSTTRVKGTMRSAGRPMLFREIYPNGAMHHVMIPGLPRRL